MIHSSMIKILSAIASTGALTLVSCQTSSPSTSETRPPGETVLSASELKTALTGTVDFSDHVKPILETKCVMCHNSDALPGRMNLSSREAAVKSGALGGFIVPGQPEKSALVTKIGTTAAHTTAMPPVGQRITADELKVLRRWIQQGADWPAGAHGRMATQG